MKHETPRHPKLQDLATALNMPLFAAAGILELLWHYAGDFTPRGDIGSASDVSIARAVDWRKKPEHLVRVLVETKWLDTDSQYRFVIHDWPDHAQEWVRVKLKRRKPPDDWLSVYGKSLYSVATDERQNIDLPQDGIGSGSAEGLEKKSKVRENLKLPKGYAFDEQYQNFQKACAIFGMPLVESDFMWPAWNEWCVLDPEQRQAAIAGIEARAEAGVDPQMVPRPHKYLRTREWERPITVRINGKRSVLDEMIAEERARRG